MARIRPQKAIRVDGTQPLKPGQYCKIVVPNEPGDAKPPVEYWRFMSPNGAEGLINNPRFAPRHTVVEHEGGAITVTPQIVFEGGMIGFITAGCWDWRPNK